MARTFAELGLSEPRLRALADVGYAAPSPIQEEGIPPLLEGRDVIGQAQTGTGKTAAFGLPIMEYVDPSEDTVQALVLTPTRELCIQVTQALRTYGAHSGIDVVAVFGGAPIRTQQAQLRAGGHVVVGTVGRVLDLISRHSLMLHDCRFVVLDEADEMLDLGFLEDVERILSLTPSSRQTALFSATMPPPIRKLADRYMYDPVIIQVEAATLTIDTVAQFQLPVDTRDKPEKLVEVLRAERPDQAIVFVRTKIRADQLFRTLRDRGLNVRALHGDMTPGVPRRGDAGLQGRARADPGRHRRGRPRAGHLDRHPRHQLRRADLSGHLRPPHRPHRPGGPLGPRDHVRRDPSEARAGGHRTPHRHQHHAVGEGGDGAPDAGQGAPPAPLQAARLACRRRRGLRQAGARGGPRGGRDAWPTSSPPSPPPRASTGRRSATCWCSTASPSCRCRQATPNA